MRKKFVCLAFFFCFAFAAGDPARGASIVFATEGDYPPWNATNSDNRLEGFDIDLIGAICRKLGAACETERAGFAAMIDALAEGRYDAIISGIAITAQRREKIDFTRPYMHLSVSFAAAAGSLLARQPPQTDNAVAQRLGTATIGAQAATVNALLVEKLLPHATLVPFDNQQALNLAVANGTVDAGIAATLAWTDPNPAQPEAIATIGPPYTSADYPILGEGLGIGIARGSPLKAAFDEAICELGGDGTTASLSRKWFGSDLSASCR